MNPSYRAQRFGKWIKSGEILPFNTDHKEDWTCDCGGPLMHFGNRITCAVCDKIIWRKK